MLRLLYDENFNNDVVRGVKLLNPDVDAVRVQDVGLRGADDPTILEWAAQEGRVLITHDVKTMSDFAYDRVRDGKPMPGVFQVHRRLPHGQVIEELVLLAVCSADGEWEGKVRHLPVT